MVYCMKLLIQTSQECPHIKINIMHMLHILTITRGKIHVCIHVYARTCTHTHMHTHTHVHTHMHTHTHTHLHAHTRTHMHTLARTHSHTHTRTHVHTHTHAHTGTHMHTQTLAYFWPNIILVNITLAADWLQCMSIS